MNINQKKNINEKDVNHPYNKDNNYNVIMNSNNHFFSLKKKNVYENNNDVNWGYNNNCYNGNDNFYPKNKKNHHIKKFKKNKDKKNYFNNNYNNMRNNNKNFDLNNYNINNNENSYDDNKINNSIMDNSTIDTMNNKYNINNDFNKDYNNRMNNIIYLNHNMPFNTNNYFNNKIQRNKLYYNNQYIRSKNFNNYNNNNYIPQKRNYLNKNINNYNYFSFKENNIIDNNQGNNNKFNINNSLDNINNFYQKTNIISNTEMKSETNIIKESFTYDDYLRFIITKNNKNIIKDKKPQKNIIFKKFCLNIKLGTKKINKEIMINLEKDNIPQIVKDILHEYNLEQNNYEPLLAIIEDTAEILNSFNMLKFNKYMINNKENNFDNLLDKDINKIDNSFIMDIIEKDKFEKLDKKILGNIDDIIIKKSKKRAHSLKLIKYE